MRSESGWDYTVADEPENGTVFIEAYDEKDNPAGTIAINSSDFGFLVQLYINTVTETNEVSKP